MTCVRFSFLLPLTPPSHITSSFIHLPSTNELCLTSHPHNLTHPQVYLNLGPTLHLPPTKLPDCIPLPIHSFHLTIFSSPLLLLLSFLLSPITYTLIHVNY